jgi:hypothetical protein
MTRMLANFLLISVGLDDELDRWYGSGVEAHGLRNNRAVS